MRWTASIMLAVAIAMGATMAEVQSIGTTPDTSDSASARIAYVALRNASEVHALDIDTGETIARIQVGPLPRGTTASRDGRRVAVITREHSAVELIDTDGNKVLGTWLFRDLLKQAFDTRLAAAGIADPTEGQIVSVFARFTIGSVLLSPDGETIYLIGREGTLLRFDIASGQTALYGFQLGITPDIQAIFGPPIHMFDPVARLSSDGRRLFAPDANRHGLMVLNSETLSVSGELPSLIYGAFDVAADDSVIASLAFQFDLADLRTFEVRRVGPEFNPSHGTYPGATRPAASAVKLSPDARLLYAARLDPMGRGSASQPYMIVALDTASGRRVAVRHLSDQPIDGLAATANGERIVAVSPATNEVHVLAGGTLETLRVIAVGPTPQAGADFIVERQR